MNSGAVMEVESVKENDKILYNVVKRFFDIIFGVIGIIFLIPLTIIIKIAYMLTGDFDSIFYSQDRIGKDGKLFRLYKFRSMYTDADKKLEELLKNDKEFAKEYKVNKKVRNDPRITKVGKVIRKCSIDEMPQFINVFIGNMSLIGNRPYLPREKQDMGDYFDDIVSTKPGITGYWQVIGHNDVDFNERLKLEQKYSKIRSFRLDTRIFFATFRVILGKKGI